MAGNKSEVAVLCRIFNIINNLILYTYKYSNYKYYLKFITLVVEDTMVAREGGGRRGVSRRNAGANKIRCVSVIQWALT